MQNSQEYNILKSSFDSYYQAKILPQLHEIEQKRKRYFFSFVFASIFTLAWCILLLQGKLNSIIDELSSKGINIGLLSCLFILLICLPMIGYHRQSKESLLPLLVNFFGSFDYSYKSVILDDTLQDSRIMPKCDKIEFDDGFNGIYDDVEVSIREYITYKEKLIRNENISQYVLKKDKRGIIFCSAMNKEFKGQTIVVTDKGIINKIIKFKGLDKVGLESPSFEKFYEVYSDNQIEARYILTPVMLEYMEKLKSSFSKIEFSFFNNSVFINIITKKNMFECNSFFTSIINKKRIYKNFNELYLLFSIIRTMHLNEQRLL